MVFNKKTKKMQPKVVKWEHYEKLYKLDSANNGVRMCPKLTREHIYLANQMKMRVYLATQVACNFYILYSIFN